MAPVRSGAAGAGVAGRSLTPRLLLLFLVSVSLIPACVPLAVMSVDLGNEWLKIGIVSPGKPMEIILNSDSGRKTPLSVAFRDGERYFGDASLSTGVRFPDKTFDYLMDLVGKKMDNPLVQRHLTRFPWLRVKPHSGKETVLLQHPDGMSFSPEELLAMILQKAKVFAEAAAASGAGTKQIITDVVITVPPYFSQAERRSVQTAAQLAGLTVLQLMNTNAAVALNYAVFRAADMNESTPTNVLFYDMGSTGTVASVVQFQVVKSKERGFVERTPTVTVKGVGYDRQLGGLEMQLRLRDFLTQKFADAKNIPLQSVRSNKRALSKLMKEAARVKKVLSANTEIVAQVENVMNDQDLKVPVTRAEFESLSSDLFSQRLVKPVDDALAAASLSIGDLHHVILFGGNTRVPKVQEILSAHLGGKELGKSINTDEAAALGAAYQAAFLSKGFKVKHFNVRDFNLFPVQVDFTREVESEEDPSVKSTKSVSRLLFGRANLFPQKKILTFSKHTDDFDFFINYGDLSGILTPEEHAMIGPLNISKVTVTGVKEILAKHPVSESADGKRVTAKGIKAHFKLNESGIIDLDRIEANFEELSEDDGSISENTISDTIAKLGSTIGKLFGTKFETDDLVANDDSQTPDEAAAGNATGGPDSDPAARTASAAANASHTSSGPEVSGKAEASANASASAKGETGSATANASASATASDAKPKEPKIRTIKEKVDFSSSFLDLNPDQENEVELSRGKLQTLLKRDEEKERRDSLRNSLESGITDTRMQMFEPEFESASTDEEKEKIQAELSAFSDWLDENSESASADDLQQKVDQLKGLTHDLKDRVKEHKLRPESVQALRNMMNISEVFLANMKNMSDQGVELFTGIEITSLEMLLVDTTVWLNDAVDRQANTSKAEAPVLTLKQIAEKSNALDREVKYLVNKMRYAPPPKTTTTPAPKKKEKKRKAKKRASATQADADLEALVEAIEDSAAADQDASQEQQDADQADDDAAPDQQEGEAGLADGSQEQADGSADRLEEHADSQDQSQEQDGQQEASSADEKVSASRVGSNGSAGVHTEL